jgi:hypothetical protein
VLFASTSACTAYRTRLATCMVIALFFLLLCLIFDLNTPQTWVAATKSIAGFNMDHALLQKLSQPTSAFLLLCTTVSYEKCDTFRTKLNDAGCIVPRRPSNTQRLLASPPQHPRSETECHISYPLHTSPPKRHSAILLTRAS